LPYILPYSKRLFHGDEAEELTVNNHNAGKTIMEFCHIFISDIWQPDLQLLPSFFGLMEGKFAQNKTARGFLLGPF
jgi:hypothetical protein